MSKTNQIRSYNDSTFRLKDNIYKFNCWASKDSFRDLAYKFSKQAFTNIENFPYVYFTSGITEALNFLIPKKKFLINQNEYRYLEMFSSVTRDSSNIDSKFLSYPFSGNGKFLDIPNDSPVVLDCSYIFASNLTNNKILPNNVDQVLFSLSKSHNLADYRLGWFFSKQKIKEFHVLQYDNHYGINNINFEILNTVNDLEPNYLYLKYKSMFTDMYNANNVSENDTNLFGLKNNMRIPWYHLLNVDLEK